MSNSKWACRLSFVYLAAVISIAGCASPKTTTHIRPEPLPTSESRSSDGFEYKVTVNNVQPVLGEKIVITTELKNISNTAVPANNTFGESTIEIKNSSGEVIWGSFASRTASTLTMPISIGYASTLDITWTVASAPDYSIEVTPGNYTLNVSDTGIFDPTLNMRFPFSVTPIQITIYE